MKKSKNLHIYGQQIWHDDLLIVGTEQSLRNLKESIDKALEQGFSRGVYMANGDEGYDLYVRVENDKKEWNRIETPYVEEDDNLDYLKSKEDIIKENNK